MYVHRSPEYWRSVVRMGATQFFMLRALMDGPAHGYDLARRAAGLSGGFCAPTEGTVYPVLKSWEADGLVEGAWEVVRGRRRRVYSLTDTGLEAYEAAFAVWTAAARMVLQVPAPPAADRLADYLL